MKTSQEIESSYVYYNDEYITNKYLNDKEKIYDRGRNLIVDKVNSLMHFDNYHYMSRPDGIELIKELKLGYITQINNEITTYLKDKIRPQYLEVIAILKSVNVQYDITYDISIMIARIDSVLHSNIMKEFEYYIPYISTSLYTTIFRKCIHEVFTVEMSSVI